MERARALIEWLSALQFRDLPKQVVEKVKDLLLDYLGVAVAGSLDPSAGLVRQLVGQMNGQGRCTVIGAPDLAVPMLAAFHNGVAGHALELDDGNRYAMGHPGVCVFPALLAAGELEKLSGRDFILGAVCGYEIFGRVGRAVNPAHFARGYHTTGTCGAIASAAAVCKALGGSDDLLASAIGLGASSAAGLMAFLEDGAMSKVYHAGHAAMTGVLAGFLGRSGFTGSRTALEGAYGFLRASSDGVESKWLTEGLGSWWSILDTYVKIHASCRHTHAPVDGAIALVHEHNLRPKDIEAIRIGVYRAALRFCTRVINTPLQARMSIPYAVAVGVIAGSVDPSHFRPEWLRDDLVRELMERTEVVFDAEMESLLPDRRGARVTIHARGRAVERVVYWPRGEPENPIGSGELRDKFRRLAVPVLGNAKAGMVIDRVNQLEAAEELSTLLSLLRTGR